LGKTRATEFYNSVTHGRTDPDLAASLGNITWGGFPKRFTSTVPGVATQFAKAEPLPTTGAFRPQDEYLEWFAHKNAAGKITHVDFTCEAYDYFQFLFDAAPHVLLKHYHDFIDTKVQLADLNSGGAYDPLNRFNTELGAIHLTHPANNLFAEIYLAASATVRRRHPGGGDETSSIPLIKCAKYGNETRNSDPNIGAAVNGFARDKRMITLANPVGLYMSSFDGAGVTLDGKPAGGFFKVVRGALPLAVRAVFEVPAAEAAQGKTVSDVKIGGTPVDFGGQLAQLITMHLVGVATVAQTVNNAPTVCGGVPQVGNLNAIGGGPALVPRTAE
jgi:hypothetical protein